MSVIQRPRDSAGRERILSIGMTTFVVCGLVSLLPVGSGLMARPICEAQPDYVELEAQIDEVVSSDAFDCLVVQPEIQADGYSGSIFVEVDLANACGEELFVVADRDDTFGELVADGELVTLSVEVEQLAGESQGEGEVAFNVSTEEDRMNGGADSGERELLRIQYSYSGTYNANPEPACVGGEPQSCATAGGGFGGSSPGSVVWVVLGLGVVWVGRRVWG